ncbi:MAG: ABC transporter substrate-binding protein [Termitinemataceae bacterium]
MKNTAAVNTAASNRSCVFCFRAFCLLFIFLWSAGLASADPERNTRFFIDSAGRTVQVPQEIRRLAPAGAIAQLFLYTIVPDRFVGWSSALTTELLPYVPQNQQKLPVFGQFYGSGSTLNMEALMAARPDIIIDIGEQKKSIAKDMDEIQRKTGTPTIFIAATALDSYAKTYRDLGQLLGVEQEAEHRARFIEDTLNFFKHLRSTVEAHNRRLRVYYGEEVTGLGTLPAQTIHSQAIDLAGLENVALFSGAAVPSRPQVSPEQILLWDPDVIILSGVVDISRFVKDPVLSSLRAVRQGRVYQAPLEPYNWIARPPSVNRLAGLYWLGLLAYPDLVSQKEFAERIKEMYRHFYHRELSEKELTRFIPSPVGK